MWYNLLNDSIAMIYSHIKQSVSLNLPIMWMQLKASAAEDFWKHCGKRKDHSLIAADWLCEKLNRKMAFWKDIRGYQYHFGHEMSFSQTIKEMTS